MTLALLADPPERGLSVRAASGSDLEAWDAYVRARPHGPMQRGAWLGVLSDAFDVAPLFLMALDDMGVIKGVMPAYFSSSALARRHVATLEGGVIADDQAAADSLFGAAAEQMKQRSGRYLLLRGGMRPSQAPAGMLDVVHTVVDTGLPVDVVWSRVQKKARWAFRQGSDLVFAALGQDEAALARFHAIFSRHQHRLGTPAPGFRFFAALLNRLGPDLKLFAVHRDSRMVAGMLCATESAGWSSLYVGLEEDARDVHVGYFLYGKVIEWMSLNRVARLDLGRSTPNQGVHRFKQKWGGTDLVSQHLYFGDRASEVAAANNELRQGTNWRQQIWRRLPHAVCGPFGARLRRQLPLG